MIGQGCYERQSTERIGTFSSMATAERDVFARVSKHEQGQNAAEIPLYDKFIDMEESKIDALKKPQAYTLTLKRVKGGEG